MNFGDGIHDEIVYRKFDELAVYDASGWIREPVGEYMLFWKPHSSPNDSNPTRGGFEFDCVSLAQGFDFRDPDGGYETVVRGLALFDGVRHVWFGYGDDGAGYLNYPDMQSMVELITRLHQLEGEYCWDAPQNRGKR